MVVVDIFSTSLPSTGKTTKSHGLNITSHKINH